jgi:transposase
MATPKSSLSTSRQRVRVAGKNPRSKKTLTSSPTEAEREIAGLRRGRERLESELTPDDTDARASLI